MSSLLTSVGRWYQRWVFKDLSKYGLRYEDCLIEREDVVTALKYLPEEERVARDKRLRRALDCSMKHIHLPEHMQAAHDPKISYLRVSKIFRFFLFFEPLATVCLH